jgi:hypothetical protein
MKNGYSSVIVMLVAMVALGCSATPAAKAPEPAPKPVIQNHHDDGFDKAGGAFADGTRYVWNESVHAYEWTKETAEKINAEYNTEENRQKAADAAEAAQKKAVEAYESLSKAISDAVNKDTCKCKKGDPLCDCL